MVSTSPSRLLNRKSPTEGTARTISALMGLSFSRSARPERRVVHGRGETASRIFDGFGGTVIRFLPNENDVKTSNEENGGARPRLWPGRKEIVGARPL